MGLNLEQTPVASFPRKERWKGDQRAVRENQNGLVFKGGRGCRKMLKTSIHQEG